MELLTFSADQILVKNPYSGRLVNVAPLFDAMQQFGGINSSSKALTYSVGRAIRLINTAGNFEGIGYPQIQDINFDLFRLQDMFDAMTEFKQAE